MFNVLDSKTFEYELYFQKIALFANANTKRLNLFVELIKTLESMNSDENCLNDLSTLIIRYLFNYSKCALKNDFDVFLANMIENKLVTIEDINGEINYLKNYLGLGKVLLLPLFEFHICFASCGLHYISIIHNDENIKIMNNNIMQKDGDEKVHK